MDGSGRSDILSWLQTRKTATLEFDDGCTFEGFSFGAPISTAGEVVFNTGMVGYPESLTDPSYAGQILVITFPLVGNYGVPGDDKDPLGLLQHFESDRIHVKAVIIADYSFVSSHYTATRSLSDWLNSQGVPGIYGVDTRRITKLIRQRGALLGKVIVEGSIPSSELPWDNPNTRNLPSEVCRPERQVFMPPKGCDEWKDLDQLTTVGDGRQLHILAVDCGMKNNIIRYLVNACRVKLTVVPWDYDFTGDEFDGLFLSNGPGDPTKCAKTIENVRKVMQRTPTVPIFGICLGNQILALAAGASTYKMPFGNRGMNQPCVDLRTSRCYITPQNHGFAVDHKTLPNEWLPLMVNANDGSNEGIIHRSKPWFSVQFHPEACGGPTDTSFLFTSFIQSVAEPAAAAVTTIPYSVPEIRRKVLVLGSGGITIGQAGEFDYSGSQALKALRENGVQSVLLNPNIATIQTSKGLADKVYFLPVTLEFATKVIQRERPDGILCSFGGQTALNCAIRLEEEGVLKKYGVQVLGTPISAIIMTEDREIFAKAVADCGYKVAESACCSTVEESVATAKQIGFPVLVRAAFACGGLGSGFANDEHEVKTLVETALVHSPQVIIDKSLKGWKELEYEVVRDRNDNCITVCNMENLDPMGVHTGDSIVIAPSQTLTNDEYFALRKCALKVVRHLGVVGECNIQYGVDPKSREFRIIEVNARLSRSSALASKATGYPLAYVAAKLALGTDLVQLRNSVTKCTTACFEPSLDYIVAKVPRWDLQKFATVDQRVGSCMKSVGEVMSIGRTFEEVIQKALRMVDESSLGFNGQRFDQELNRRADKAETIDSVRAELETPTPMRIWAVAKAFDLGMGIEDVHKLTNIDRWFLAKLFNIHELGSVLKTQTYAELSSNPALLREAKQRGFSDKQVAECLKHVPVIPQSPSTTPSLPRASAAEKYKGGQVFPAHIRHLRQSIGLRPVVKQIDTLAAEFPADTNYLYLTYHGVDDDVDLAGIKEVKRSPVKEAFRAPDERKEPKGDSGNQRVVVLGCGPYRIGSSVEFDWCSVSCLRTLRSLGHNAIVINCNPETVSTDYDESDRLYFEELSHETVMDIIDLENPGGVVVSVGGQTPNNLAMGLSKCGVQILGTSVEAIDTCENRFKFSKLCDTLRIDQPEWSQFTTVDEAFQFCRLVGYPALVRPSYVLSGAAMRVVNTDAELELFLGNAAVVSRDFPVVISKYISGAKEVELDAVAQNGEIINYAIAEHVENAGVHSGDATLLLPAQKLFVETHRRVKKIGQKICAALKISGPVNIQFMCKENEVKVIETNLRASRSLPFISKTYDVNFIDIATRIMLGANVNKAVIQPIDMDHVSCKVPMFSFARLKNSDPRLGVEMQSTGEVASFGFNQHEAFLKGMIAAGFKVPSKNVLVSLGPTQSKIEFVQSVQLLSQMGFQIYATKGTCEFLRTQDGLQSVVMVYKPLVKREPNVQTMLQGGKIDMVVNVPDSMDSHGVTDGFEMRRMAVDSGTSLITDIKVAILTVHSLHRKWVREKEGREFYSIKTWQEYVENR
eukprot:TRINITY_DN10184_c0_g3_i1.p1 TRINITY_DN10184_c0_g3~~TRINITY_DN10184_c0_g3_i1.p1  ORF type:complete len:1551 (+),score=263.04 TRINITY_DN10184_c0_g3_i1:62-4714(+)